MTATYFPSNLTPPTSISSSSSPSSPSNPSIVYALLATRTATSQPQRCVIRNRVPPAWRPLEQHEVTVSMPPRLLAGRRLEALRPLLPALPKSSRGGSREAGVATPIPLAWSRARAEHNGAQEQRVLRKWTGVPQILRAGGLLGGISVGRRT